MRLFLMTMLLLSMSDFSHADIEKILGFISKPAVIMPSIIDAESCHIYRRLKRNIAAQIRVESDCINKAVLDFETVFRQINQGHEKLVEVIKSTDFVNELPPAYCLEVFEAYESDLPEDFYFGYYLLAMIDLYVFEKMAQDIDSLETLVDSLTALSGAQLSFGLGEQSKLRVDRNKFGDAFLWTIHNYSQGIKAESKRREGKSKQPSKTMDKYKTSLDRIIESVKGGRRQSHAIKVESGKSGYSKSVLKKWLQRYNKGTF